jgi:RHS repeat-associated protein
VWEYYDDIIFKNGAIYQVAHDEGRSVATNNGTWQHEFDYKDHLGNTRLTFRDSLANPINGIYPPAIITAQTDFDPLGIRLPIGVKNRYQNRFEFLNREKESTFGLNIIRLGARGYNPTNGRFDRIDPKADEAGQESFSPYHYGLNNPVRYSDPDGECVPCVIVLGALLLTSQPALAPTGKDPKAEQAAYNKAYNAMGSDIIAAALPMAKAEKVSTALYSVAKKEFKEEVKEQAQKAVSKTDNTKQIGPAGDAGATVTKQMPKDWNMKPSDKGNGTKFIDPKNSAGNNVRVQGGNPNSSNPAQQQPYVRETKNGKVVDVKGNEVNPKSAESHIPKEKYRYDRNN